MISIISVYIRDYRVCKNFLFHILSHAWDYMNKKPLPFHFSKPNKVKIICKLSDIKKSISKNVTTNETRPKCLLSADDN